MKPALCIFGIGLLPVALAELWVKNPTEGDDAYWRLKHSNSIECKFNCISMYITIINLIDKGVQVDLMTHLLLVFT